MKISFFLINMNLGGTEKAFLNLANELLKLNIEIELILLECKGDLLKAVPANIAIKTLDYSCVKDLFEKPPKIVLIQLIKNLQLTLVIQYFFYRVILHKIFNTKLNFYNWLSNKMLTEKINCDAAVAFAGPHDLISFIVANKIQTKKRFQWIHFDISKISFDQKYYYSNLFKKYDQVFSVSMFVKRQLERKINNIKPILFYNILPIKEILKLSKIGENYSDNQNEIKILTIGRLTEEKGFDIAIDVARRLKEKDIHFKWYLIGDGTQKNALIQKTKLYDLENEIIFLGMKRNPYTYLKNCDIYVQPSRHEGFGISVSEAKIFNKPIVVTNIPGFREQIIHKRTGFISEDLDPENLLKGIEYFLNEENRNFVKSNFETSKNGNVFGVKEFLRLLN
ncbi:MAG: glycosyltransferase [Bacteroidota bacterium]